MNGLQKAIKHFGSKQKLAGALGLHVMAITQWQNRSQVPAERAREIERLSGGVIAASELRPDLFDPVLDIRNEPK